MQLNLNKETIFIIALEKMDMIMEKSWMGSLGSETQILYFRNNYSKQVLKNIERAYNLVFDILWELRVQILKNHEDKVKRRLLTFVSMFFIYSILNEMLRSQSA